MVLIKRNIKITSQKCCCYFSDYWSPYRFYAYYDPGVYTRFSRKPIWMTEVSSTFPRIPTVANQLKEGLDLAAHITNFVGTTCVQRYYFWSMYTDGDSGESLIWGNFNQSSLHSHSGNPISSLYYPKTYHVYKHFTKASYGGDKSIIDCKVTRSDHRSHLAKTEQLCLIFHDKIVNRSTTVFVNRANESMRLNETNCVTNSPLCCTTLEFDWWCINSQGIRDKDDASIVLPKKSVCSCQTATLHGPVEFIATSRIFTNDV